MILWGIERDQYGMKWFKFFVLNTYAHAQSVFIRNTNQMSLIFVSYRNQSNNLQ